MATIRKVLDSVSKKSGYERLEPRERFFLLGGIVFICGFLIFQGVISPFLDARQKLERSLLQKKNDMLEMEILKGDYQELRLRQGEITRMIDQRSPNFSLFSFLEQQANAVRVKNRVTYMKPSTAELEDGFQESAVEMKMEQITLKQLVDFLTRVESLEQVVVVKRLAVQKNKKEADLLDVVATIVTFEKGLETGT